MKLIKNKKTLSIIALVTLIAVLGTSIFLSSQTALAAARLPGMDTLIKEKTSETEAFHILEIVEDAVDYTNSATAGRYSAEIGFYFEGNEPFSLDEDGYATDFETTIGGLFERADRDAYVKGLLTFLDGKYWTKGDTTTSKNDYPLVYTPYEDAYFLSDTTGWNRIDFEEFTHVNMYGEYVPVDGGTDENPVYGDYTKSEIYQVAYDAEASAENKTYVYKGTHVENLQGFSNTSTQKAYNVTFALKTSETPADKLALGVYTKEVVRYGVVTSADDLLAYQELNNGVYWLKNADDTYTKIDLSEYTFAETAPTDTTLKVILPNTELYDISYAYAGTSSNDSSTEFYCVDTYSYAYDGQNYGGRYGALLKEDEEHYILAPEGSVGTHKLSDEQYSYTPGTGDHNFVEAETVTKDMKPVLVETGGFYYKGGFSNNNWFRKHVFVSEQTDIDLNLLPVEVRTLTISQLYQECLENVNVFNNIDMLVINGDANAFSSYETGISTTVIENIAARIDYEITRNKMPCIINSDMAVVTAGDGTGSVIDQKIRSFYTITTPSAIGSVSYSIYWYDQDLINVDFTEIITDEAGFADVLEYIETENKYLELRKETLLSEDITQAIVIQYILCCKYGRNIVPKNELTVLEIEPCASYYFDEADPYPSEGVDPEHTAKEKVRVLTGYTDEQLPDSGIKIVRMTTSEFVGKIHDLNGVYDFIYIGMKTDKMNMYNNLTSYNDTSMNGLVYTHTGDAIISAERLTGLLDTDYVQSNRSYLPYSRDVYKLRTTKENGKLVLKAETIEKGFDINYYEVDAQGNKTAKEISSQTVTLGNQGVYRYSGNDITPENVEMLQDYVNAGYPIILDENLVNVTGNVKTVNASRVDNSSYLYDFLSFAVQKNNVFLKNESLSSSENFRFYMNLPKLDLVFYKETSSSTSETYYEKDTDAGNHLTDSTERFVKKMDGQYYLTYVFSIEDKAAASTLDSKYTVSLFVDINSDGKYSRAHEKMQDIKVTTEDGDYVAYNDLTEGEIYIVTRRIPEAFRSVVPWKLEVSLTDNTTTSGTTTGTTQTDESTQTNDATVVTDENTETEEGTGENTATQESTTSASTSSNSTKLSLIRKSHIGYSKLYTDKETDIKVLQILSELKGTRDSNTWDLEADYGKEGSEFRTDIQALTEYNITFNSIYVNEYEDTVPVQLPESTTFKDRTEAYYSTLNEYDMLIIGFSDVYEGFTDKDGVEAILQFIDSGKSVLFTHDTTSFVNYDGTRADNIDGTDDGFFIFSSEETGAIGGTRWGYLFNQIVRDELGMDRYGITNWRGYLDENTTSTNSTSTLSLDEAKELLSQLLKRGQILEVNEPVKKYITDTRYTGTVAQLFEAAEKDAAYVVGTNKTQTYPETQGYTYTTLNNCEAILTNTGSDYQSYSNQKLNLNSSSGVENLGKTWADSFRELFGVSTDESSNNLWNSIFDFVSEILGAIFDALFGSIHNGSFDNMTISCINQGQITEYPYKIGDTINVASTHAQYYQLDLEADKDKDGESDICVWYAIANGYNNKTSYRTANPYNASPNDVRNNYYIYSIGNVFYTGAGHKAVSQSEKRLFINTIVAAYNAAANEPSVTILEAENVAATEVSSKNLPVEYSLADQTDNSAYIGENPIKVHYSVYDDNFVYASETVKRLSVEYYIEDIDNVTTLDETMINGVKVRKLDNVVTTQGNSTVNTIRSGNAYTMVWSPNSDELYDYLSNKESFSIFVKVRAEFKYKSKDIKLDGYDKIIIKKTNLFELD